MLLARKLTALLAIATFLRQLGTPWYPAHCAVESAVFGSIAGTLFWTSNKRRRGRIVPGGVFLWFAVELLLRALFMPAPRY
jgi:hypothetical protein